MNQNNKQEEKNSKLRELTDTSSVVAHDLCAQLHVLQFCLEELDGYIDPEGKEYLKRMSTSTKYISNLVDSFRKGLKVNLNDEQAYFFDEIYEPALELIKNHYFVVLERANFLTEMPSKMPQIKNKGRTYMSILFGIYSVFLDELKASEEELSTMNFRLKLKHENSRFVRVCISIEPTQQSDTDFLNAMDTTAPSKGKMRQFIGLNALKEMVGDVENAFEIVRNQNTTTIGLILPLECQ